MINLRSGFLTFLMAVSFLLTPHDGMSAEILRANPITVIPKSDVERSLSVPMVYVIKPGVLPINAVDEYRCLKNIFESQIKSLNDNKMLPIVLQDGRHLTYKIDSADDRWVGFYEIFEGEKGKTIKNFLPLDSSDENYCHYKTVDFSNKKSDTFVTLRVSLGEPVSFVK